MVAVVVAAAVVVVVVWMVVVVCARRRCHPCAERIVSGLVRVRCEDPTDH